MSLAPRCAPALLFALAALLGGCGTGKPPAVSPDAAVRQVMDARHIPGAAIAILSGTAPAQIATYGMADVASGRRVDDKTRFEIGSLTKQFTAAAILQLRERGKLSLDDPLGKYVPQYAAARDVTIRQLLWHVSGVPDMCSRGCTGEDELMQLIRRRGSVDAVLAIVERKPLEFRPGTKWKYSNANYILLGRIVELASGMPWDRYVRTHIFQPAGMTRSSFTDVEGKLDDMATGYYAPKGTLVPSPPLNGWGGGAGAIVSTAGDLAKWDAALFRGKLISAADVSLMTTSGRLNDGTKTGYGFGWVIDVHDGQRRIWHNGATVGFSSWNGAYPAMGQTIVVLTNALLANGSADPIADALFAALHPDLAASQTVAAPGEKPAVTARAKEWWRRLRTGTIDRSQLTAEFNAHLTPTKVGKIREQLAPFGDPFSWTYRGMTKSGNVTQYAYRITFSGARAFTFDMNVGKDGKISEFSLHSE